MYDGGVSALYQEIGRAIYQLRNQRSPRMSQKALADTVGVSRASIANIERGHHRVQLHVLYDIATALDVEPHDLLPHSERGQSTNLPDDVSKELSPKERAAVDRLLRSGKKRETSDEKS
jgi:transcriptional regulator with XRE-family HTH domain